MRLSRHLPAAALSATFFIAAGCGESSSLFRTSDAPSGGGSTSSTSSGSGGSTSTSSSGVAGSTSSSSSGAGGAGGSGGTGVSCEPVGHDEDGDTVDDNCDNCPSYWNEGQVNGDQDGVGDVCEAPEEPPLWSTIELFESFSPAPGPSWDLGEYSPAVGDEIEVNTPYQGRNADWLEAQAGPYSVETNFAYDGNSGAWAGVRFGINGGSWWACLVERYWGGSGAHYNLAIWHYPGTGNQVLLQAETQDVGAEPAGIPRRVRAHVRPGGHVICTYEDTEGGNGQVEVQGGNLDGFVGLRAYDTHAHFFNYVIYK